MGGANGLALADRPSRLHYSERQDVVSWRPVTL
jgi:hypothetical protein